MPNNQTQKNTPQGWRQETLKDVGYFSKGAGISKSELVAKGNNAVRYGELYTKFNFKIDNIYSFIPDEVVEGTKEIKYGDIVFAGSGETIDEIGKSAAYLLKDKGYASGDTIIFTPKKDNSLFLAYLLNINGARKELRRLGQGQSVVHIYKSDIEKIVIEMPPLPEQKQIVKVLETWDKAIELLAKKIEIKKNIKKGLMQRLLIGKVRLPGHNDKWQKVKLGIIFKERKEKDNETNGIKLYSLTIENGVCPKSERYDRSYLVKSESKDYKKTYYNDIVYNPANLRFGAIAINKNIEPVLLSPIYKTLFVRNNNEYSIDFLAHLLTWDRQIKIMSSYAEGTLVERMEVKIEAFKQIIIDIPKKKKEQDSIADILNKIDLEISTLVQKNKYIKEQKRYLLNNLVTGKIRMP